jgi:hypothetical protein
MHPGKGDPVKSDLLIIKLARLASTYGPSL